MTVRSCKSLPGSSAGQPRKQPAPPPSLASGTGSHCLRGRVGLRDGPAGRLAGPHVGCDQLLRNDVNCTDVITTGVDASASTSCAALTATGAVLGSSLLSNGAISGSSLSITGAASVGLLSSATGITHHQQHGQRWELHHGRGRVHGHPDCLRRSDGGELRSHRNAHGPASAGPLDCESLDCTFTATSGGVSTGSVVCGNVTSSGTVSAPPTSRTTSL